MALPGKQVKHPVAPTMRYAFLKALDIKGEKEGKTLPEIMYELIKQEGLLAVMDRVSRFQEKQADLNVNHTGEVTSLVGVLGALSGYAEGNIRNPEVAGEPGQLRH